MNNCAEIPENNEHKPSGGSKAQPFEDSTAASAGELPLRLSEIPPGSGGKVCGLGTGREFRGRAIALGFTAGAEVQVLQNFGSGPMIVLVRGTRMALGRGEAMKILLEVV